MKSGAQEYSGRRMLSWTWRQRVGVDSAHMLALMPDIEPRSFDVQTHIQRTRPSEGWLFWLLFWIHQWRGDLGRAEHNLTDTLSRAPNPTWVLCTGRHSAASLRHSQGRAGSSSSFPCTSSTVGTGTLGAAKLSNYVTEPVTEGMSGTGGVERIESADSFGTHSQPHLLTRKEKGRPIFSKKSR